VKFYKYFSSSLKRQSFSPKRLVNLCRIYSVAGISHFGANYAYISLICDKSLTTQNLAFFIFWYKKKRLHMQFNKCSVITQFAKLAAGEQLCRRCTHRKL